VSASPHDPRAAVTRQPAPIVVRAKEVAVRGLMMDFPLTIPVLLRRAAQLGGAREIVSRWPDRSISRTTHEQFAKRATSLGAALLALGVRKGDRVATLCWNHHHHLEAYFGVPLAGGVLHTLNLRLHPDDLAYIANHAEDRVLIVDACLLPLFEKFRQRVQVDHVIVIGAGTALPADCLDYEQIVARGDVASGVFPDLHEDDAAALCYTSGTTGRPKGVLYSHRSVVLHSFATAMGDALGLSQRDCLLPVVPMFHVNAWGLPFTAVMVGAKIVFPGPHLDPDSLTELFETERVTLACGVPTVWMALLQWLDANKGKRDLSSIRSLTVGGAAPARALIEAYKKRHGLTMVQGWGMTEMSPVGSLSLLTAELAAQDEEVQFAQLAKQGRPLPFVEIRARSDDGLVPWDGSTMGELEVRGPWVTSGYFRPDSPDDKFTDDGWFRTGDIATIAPDGYLTIQDRAKDVIKSGGEWISSVALENAIMAHPDVAEAAVVAVPDPKWDERPLAAVVRKAGSTLTAEDLRAFLAAQVVKWWIPERIEFIEEIPKTSVGKFKKSELRRRFA
jgi:fatty-acyl-CoA synthase